MSTTLEAIKLLKEHRERLHLDEKLAREEVMDGDAPEWVEIAFRIHTEMAEEILDALVPGGG